jgi:RHS repeat-associated protein
VAQSWYSATNRIATWGYDGSGNILSVASMQRSFAYDAENRQKSATINGTATTYVYDGDGRRVQKVTGGSTTTYVYDAQGRLAAEYGPASDSGTRYLTGDHLGGTRLLTDHSGNVVKCYDYYPFGAEIAAGVDGRPSCYSSGSYPASPDLASEKFTAKERDAETGLDFFGARYNSSAQGRFTSADPESASASLFDPQRWNAYSYAVNNPLKFVDRDGENPLLATALIGAGVGAVGGAVFDVTNQLIQNGWDFSAINGSEVGGAALGGAVSGGIAGLTLGLIPAPAVPTTGYLVTAAVVNGGANVIGGVVQREVDPNASGSAVTDFAAGAVGGAVGTKIAYARYPLPNVRKELAIIANSNRRSLRPQRVADFNRYANQQTIRNNTVGSVVGTSVANFATNLWSDLTSFFSQPKQQVTTKICYSGGPGCPTDSPRPQPQQ